MGSEHNDEFYTDENGNIRTRSNRSGGNQGGISNGQTIYMRIAFKPTSTIGKKQNSVTRDRIETELIARGRHDLCVVPRAVPMVESMVALVLLIQLISHKRSGTEAELYKQIYDSSSMKSLFGTVLGRYGGKAEVEDAFLQGTAVMQ